MDSQIIKQSNPQKLSFHPFLTIFPEMGKVAFDEFVADIRDHGIREAIWTHKNQIIDGRNRWLACEQLVLPCPTREYVGDEKDLLAFVISQNLHRRQLDASQRAMVAARIATMRQGARTDLQPRPNLAEVSIQDAGKLLNVSTGNVKSAKRVIAKAEPEIVKAVEQGKLAVSAATKVALQPADVQRHAVAKIDEGAKGADVVRALPPSGGKAKRPSVINIAAKKPPTAAMKKRAHELWLFMLECEEWTLEEASEIWPLLSTAEQSDVVRAARGLAPRLSWFVEAHRSRSKVQ